MMNEQIVAIVNINRLNNTHLTWNHRLLLDLFIQFTDVSLSG